MRRGSTLTALFLMTLLILPSATAGAGTITNPSPSSTPSTNEVTPISLSGYRYVGELGPSANILVTIAVPLRNLPQLQSLVKSISTPGSTDYNHFLGSQELESMFLPTARFNQVISYLRGRGFSISFTALDSIIVAETSVANARASLGLKFMKYSNGTLSYYSAVGVPLLQDVYVYSSNVTSVLLAKPPTLVTEKSLGAFRAMTQGYNNTFAIEAYPVTLLQSVYNATHLYSKGINGKGYTMGILDFYGNPQIAQELRFFDRKYGIPDPPNFHIVSIGAYNPNLGPPTGWADEISLDVEASHAMAPGAGMTLYVGNGALSLAAAVAFVVKQHSVSVLSQSFSIPESFFSTLGPSFLEFNAILSDEYYMLGSAEGITFLGSSGDAGGSGYSAGPEGTVGYPSSSPYVTAVGGTTTYIDSKAGTFVSDKQTAWSNYGFVPFLLNYGGSTGGVSIVEPKPWYQSGLASPAGYPTGRLVPDIALNADLFPGIFIIGAQNATEISGGTSESSPLLAGLLTLVMQANGVAMGLANTKINTMAQDPALYSRAFTPITFGYNIPWQSKYGYNLVTGWGSINTGEFAALYPSTGSHEQLAVEVTVANSTLGDLEFPAGSIVKVSANVTYHGQGVASGAFTATFGSLQGTFQGAALVYNKTSNLWQGQFTLPGDAEGISYVNVQGSSGALQGSGFSEIFSGYVATYFLPTAIAPWSTNLNIPVIMNVTSLRGSAITSGAFGLRLDSYSIQKNEYAGVGNVHLLPCSSVFNLTTLYLCAGPTYWVTFLSGNYPLGPTTLVATGGAYGYLPFMNGIDIQQSLILPPVVAEPGSVAPGQALTVLGLLDAPGNLYGFSAALGTPLFEAVQVGANVTASLLDPSGKVVSSVPISGTGELQSSTQQQVFLGYLPVPRSAAAGLYTIALDASYNSSSIGKTIGGSFYGQVYVSPQYTVPKISGVSSAVYEGESIRVAANITYPAGAEVKYGMYSATIYPKNMQNSYPSLTTVEQVPLWYDPQTNLWVGNASLPSPSNAGVLSSVLYTLQYGGPYDVFVSGVSADGVPTTTAISAQRDFFIQPYVYLAGQRIGSLAQASQLALYNDTIAGVRNSIEGSTFLGENTVTGSNLLIALSTINGTLNIRNSNVTLMQVRGGRVVARNSEVRLVMSNVSSIVLSNSRVNVTSSVYGKISPAPPVVTIGASGATEGVSGVVNLSVSAVGENITSVKVFFDGRQLQSFNSGGTFSIALDSTSYPDGSYQVRATATQDDGISSSASASLTLVNTIGDLTKKLVAANDTINSLNHQLVGANQSIQRLREQQTVENQSIANNGVRLVQQSERVTMLTGGLYVTAVVAVASIVLSVRKLRKK